MDYAAAVKKLAGSGDALPRPVIQKPKEVNRVAQQPAPQQNQPASPVVKRNIDKDSLPPSYFSSLPSNFIKDVIAHLSPEAVSTLASTNHFGNIVFGSREVWNKFKLKNLSLTPLSVRVAVQIPQQSADDKKENGEEQTDDQAGNENENNDEGRYTTVKELLQREGRLKLLADRLLSEVDKQGKALKLNGGFRFYQKGQNQNTPLGIECTQLGYVSKWLEAVADMFKDKQRVQLPVNDKEEITLQRLGRAGRILKAILPGDKPAVYFTFEDFAAGVYQQGLNLSKLFDKLDETIAAREKRFPDQAAFKDNLKTLREKFNKKALDAALNETRGWFTKSTTAYAQLAERITGAEEKKKKVATRIKAEYKDMHTFINIPAVKEYFPAQDESEPDPIPAPVVAAAPENGAAEPAEKKDTKKNKKGKKEQPAQGEQLKKVTPKAAPKETGPDDFAEDPRNVRLQRKRDLQSESRDSQEIKADAPKPKETKAAAPTPAPAANTAAKSFTDKNFFDIIVNKSEKDVEKMLQEPAEKPAAAKPKSKPKPKPQEKPKAVETAKPVTSAPQPAATPAPAAAKKQAAQPQQPAKTEKQQPKDKKDNKQPQQQPPKEKQQPKEKKPQPPKEKKVTVVEPTPAPQPPKEKKPKKQPTEPTRKPAAPAQLDKDTQSKLKKVAAKTSKAKGGALQQLQDDLLNNPKQLAIGAAAAILALVLYYMMSNKQ